MTLEMYIEVHKLHRKLRQVIENSFKALPVKSRLKYIKLTMYLLL
jgi:hypothetical protein